MDKIGNTTLERMTQAKHYNDWLFYFIHQYLHGDILEVGCGIGTFTRKLAEYGKVYAIDISEGYVKKTKQNTPSANTGIGDIEKGKYFFRNNKFDAIINLNVLEHIKDDKAALKNMNKLLKAKGKLILLTPSHMFAYGEIDRNLGHYRRYSKKDLVKKFESTGFRVVQNRYLNFLGLLGWFVSGRMFRSHIIPKGHLGIFNMISTPFLFIEKFIEPPFGLSIFIVGEKK